MKKLISLHGKTTAWVVTALLFAMSEQVLAAQAGIGTEAIDKLTVFIKAAGVLLILLITIAGFIWIGWSTLVKFNDARAGRSEWGEVGLLAVVAVGVLVFLGYLLDQASTLVA